MEYWTLAPQYLYHPPLSWLAGSFSGSECFSAGNNTFACKGVAFGVSYLNSRSIYGSHINKHRHTHSHTQIILHDKKSWCVMWRRVFFDFRTTKESSILSTMYLVDLEKESYIIKLYEFDNSQLIKFGSKTIITIIQKSPTT